MQRHRNIILLLFFLLAGLLTACSPGHLGSNEIAFIRNGQLWTIDPNGSNAFAVISSGSPVIGYGWSPNHQILVYRTLDNDFAKTTAAKHLQSNPLTGLSGDVPADLNTIGIDGGTPIPITFPSSAIQRSNAWWNITGTRLLYRESTPATSPGAVSWWVAQNDQPEGIARKSLPYSYSIPSLDPKGSLAIGNAQEGVFTTTVAGADLHYMLHTPLPGHPLPATLERILWQPAHQNPALLYAILAVSQSFNAPSLEVQLTLREVHGHLTTITTCACTQFAWSPDGNSLLYTTGASYTVFNPSAGSSFTFSAEDGSVPYWSPDSQFLLLDGLHTLRLVQIANRQQQIVLSDTSSAALAQDASTLPEEVNALLQPLSNSLWAADSRHFLFLTRGRLLWQGHQLNSGKGLYTVTIDNHGKPQGLPGVVDTGNDTQAGWTYEDPDTSFLF